MPTDATLTDVPTRVPDGEEPAATCPHCDRPFRSEHARDLHLGEAHERGLTDDQRARYDHALEEESDELFVYHFKAVVALGVVWAVTVLLYMVALGSGFI
jgi:uncharacterized C2H2 Zn-finger protein